MFIEDMLDCSDFNVEQLKMIYKYMCSEFDVEHYNPEVIKRKFVAYSVEDIKKEYGLDIKHHCQDFNIDYEELTDYDYFVMVEEITNYNIVDRTPNTTFGDVVIYDKEYYGQYKY